MQKAIIITAPSGAGKTTLVKMLLNKRSDLAFSVSACTRKKREGESDGKDYYFLSESEFRNKISKKAFVEWEEVYEGMFYGTLYSELERIWAQNKIIIFDIDVQGALHLKEALGSKALSIFIAPPNSEALKKRLQLRGTESDESLQRRFGKAVYELQFQSRMDSFIINDKLDEAFKELELKVENFIKDEYH